MSRHDWMQRKWSEEFGMNWSMGPRDKIEDEVSLVCLAAAVATETHDLFLQGITWVYRGSLLIAVTMTIVLVMLVCLVSFGFLFFYSSRQTRQSKIQAHGLQHIDQFQTSPR
jgi:hypothetical protein